MARPKGSERRKQRQRQRLLSTTISAAAASQPPDPIHPAQYEQTQPVPSETSFEFSSPFPTARCPGSSSSTTSSSTENDIEFVRGNTEINTRSFANDLTIAPQDSGIPSGRNAGSIGASSIWSELLLPGGYPFMTYLGNGISIFSEEHFDPRNWFCEPRKINMQSQMTPRTLQNTDLNLVAGQRSTDHRMWDAGFDPRLFARSVRIRPTQKPFVPYTLRGTHANYQAYHQTLNAYTRRRRAANELTETLKLSAVSEFASSHFQETAWNFFGGKPVPEEFETTESNDRSTSESSAQPPSNSEVRLTSGPTFWSRVVANKLLEEPKMSVFLIDVIMANEMEEACVSKSKYDGNVVRRHETYEATEQDITTQFPNTIFLELNAEEDKISENDNLSELGSNSTSIATAPPGASEKRKKSKKQKAAKKTNTSAKGASEEDSAQPVTPQDHQSTIQGRAASPSFDETEDSPPPKLPSKPENLPKLSDDFEMDGNTLGWSVVENKFSQKNRSRGNPRTSVIGLFQNTPTMSTRSQPTLPRVAASQMSSPTSWKQAKPNPTAQKRLPQSTGAVSPKTPSKSDQRPTVTKDTPPAPKDVESRVFNDTEYPAMPPPTASNSPSQARDRGGKTKDQQSNNASRRLDESTPERTPFKERGPAIKNPTALISHRSATHSKRLEGSPSERASFKEQAQVPASYLSAKGRKHPYEASSDRAHSTDHIPTANISSALASVPCDESISTPLSDVGDTLMGASAPMLGELENYLLDGFQRGREFEVEEPKSTFVLKASNNEALASQSASNISPVSVESSTDDHTANSGGIREHDESSSIIGHANAKRQTPPIDEETPVPNKAMPTITDSRGISDQACAGANASDECATPAPTIADPGGEHVNESESTEVPVLQNDPHATSATPVRHKNTQSLPDNQSGNMGSEVPNPCRPEFSINDSSRMRDQPAPALGDQLPLEEPINDRLVKETPLSNSGPRNSSLGQPLFSPHTNAQPGPPGQNFGGKNHYGLPPPMAFDGPPAQLYFHPPPSMFGPQMQFAASVMPPGYPDPRINYSLSTFEHSSAIGSVREDSARGRVTVVHREMILTNDYEGNHAPRTLEGEHRNVTEGNEPSESTKTPVQHTAPGPQEHAQSDTAREAQDASLDNAHDAALELINTPQDPAVQSDQKNSDDVVDDVGQQPDLNPKKASSDHVNGGQGINSGGSNHLNALSGPQKGNGAGSERAMNTKSNETNSAKAFHLSMYGCAFCTFCTRECPTNPEKPVIIFCPSCGPKSNICYCSQACIVGDAYDHKVHCQMYPTSQRKSDYRLPPGYYFYVDPIMPMEPFNDSREKFRQKTFMMYCPEGPFPKILKAWGRRAGNIVPKGVDINENGKQTGSYFVFRSKATPPATTAGKTLKSSDNTVFDKCIHNADVIFAITLPKGNRAKVFLSRALNCCFLSDDKGIKESLFRIIRHFILDEKEFNQRKHEEPQSVVFEEFERQFEKEFNFDVAAFNARDNHLILDLDFEWQRCGAAIKLLESRNEVLHNWWPLS